MQEQTARAKWLRIGSVLGSVGAFAVVFLWGAFMAMFSNAAMYPGVPQETFDGLVTLLALVLGISMFWRQRFPVWIFYVSVATTVFWHISSIGLLIALTWVLARTRTRTAVVAGVVAGVVTALEMRMDLRRPPEFTFYSVTDPVTGGIETLPWWGYAFIWATTFGIAVAVGLARRSRSQARHAVAAAAKAQAVTGLLRGELSRQQEREIIAREMHDTVAHQLSLIALQAGVLEVTSSDPNVPDSARLMRGSVHKALDEMRVLISSLKDSDAGGYTGITPDFADLEGLIEEATAAGVEVNANLMIAAEGTPSTRLTSAVFRIVQECLTNAIRYGTKHPIVVLIAASPSAGVFVDVINQVAPDTVPGQGSRSGLPGMTERAQSIGGELSVVEHNGFWRVIAQLPWSEK